MNKRIESLQSYLVKPKDYILLDSFESESCFFYNRKIGEVLELELGQKLIHFQNGKHQLQWRSYFFLGMVLRIGKELNVCFINGAMILNQRKKYLQHSFTSVADTLFISVIVLVCVRSRFPQTHRSSHNKILNVFASASICNIIFTYMLRARNPSEKVIEEATSITR